jgi:hypothetical protein
MFFFQKYRQILSGDIIHVRRADMQSIDAFLHINNVVGNEKDPVNILNYSFILFFWYFKRVMVKWKNFRRSKQEIESFIFLRRKIDQEIGKALGALGG